MLKLCLLSARIDLMKKKYLKTRDLIAGKTNLTLISLKSINLERSEVLPKLMKSRAVREVIETNLQILLTELDTRGLLIADSIIENPEVLFENFPIGLSFKYNINTVMGPQVLSMYWGHFEVGFNLKIRDCDLGVSFERIFLRSKINLKLKTNSLKKELFEYIESQSEI